MKNLISLNNCYIVFTTLLSTPKFIALTQFDSKGRITNLKQFKIKVENLEILLFWYLSCKYTYNKWALKVLCSMFWIWYMIWYVCFSSLNLVYELACDWCMFGIQKWPNSFNHDWKYLIGFFMFCFVDNIWKELVCDTLCSFFTQLAHSIPEATRHENIWLDLYGMWHAGICIANFIDCVVDCNVAALYIARPLTNNLKTTSSQTPSTGLKR